MALCLSPVIVTAETPEASQSNLILQFEQLLADLTRKVEALIAPQPQSVAPTSAPTQPANQAQEPRDWIIGREAVTLLQSSGASASLIDNVFNNTDTYTHDTSDLPSAISTETFTSFAKFQTAIANQTITPGTKAILYDNEKWSITPSNEQHNPVYFAEKAAALAHANGYKFIFTPAANLADVLAPGTTDKYSTFLSLAILGESSPYVDAIDIQAQGAQGTPEYTTFVRQAVSQIRAASSTVTIFAGLSSEPQGRAVTNAEILSDYDTTKSYVNGYWMNIPVGGPDCPTCGTGNPAVAIAFLKAI